MQDWTATTSLGVALKKNKQKNKAHRKYIGRIISQDITLKNIYNQVCTESIKIR